MFSNVVSCVCDCELISWVVLLLLCSRMSDGRVVIEKCVISVGLVLILIFMIIVLLV